MAGIAAFMNACRPHLSYRFQDIIDEEEFDVNVPAILKPFTSLVHPQTLAKVPHDQIFSQLRRGHLVSQVDGSVSLAVHSNITDDFMAGFRWALDKFIGNTTVTLWIYCDGKLLHAETFMAEEKKSPYLKFVDKRLQDLLKQSETTLRSDIWETFLTDGQAEMEWESMSDEERRMD